MSEPTGHSRLHTAAQPLWFHPLVVFFAVAGSISVVGSLILVAIWLAVGNQSDPPNLAQAQPEPNVAAAVSGGTSPAVSPPLVSPSPISPPSVENQSAPPSPPIVEAAVAAIGLENPATPPAGVAPPKVSPSVTTKVGRGVKTFALDQFPTVQLPGDAIGFAYAPEQQHLAIIGPWDSAVGIIASQDLSGSGEVTPQKVVPLPSQPTGIVFRPLAAGGVFAVGHAEPNGLTLIDAKSLELVKTIPLEQGIPRHLAAAGATTTPFVYVALSKTKHPYWSPLGTLRIDAERGGVDSVWEQRIFRDFAVSADGEFLYTRPDNSSTDLHRSRPVKPSEGNSKDNWQTVTSRAGDVTRPYVPDVRGLYVAAGLNLFTADVAHRLFEMEFDPLAFLTDQPWTAGLRKDEFVVGSINDGRMVAKIPLPPDWLITNEKDRRPPTVSSGPTAIHPMAFAQVIADEQQGRFLLGVRRHVAVFAWDKLDLPQEPLLAIVAPPPTTAAVGANYEVALKTVSGTPQAELIEGPPGMTVENGAVHWTPAADQVGDSNVRVRLTDGNVSHEDIWRVTVRQKSMELPFLVLGCETSTDGQRALVWGHQWPSEEKSVDHWTGYQAPPESHLAIIDLAAGGIIASRKIDAVIAQGELNATGAYVTTNSGDANGQMEVVRLSPTDLKPAGRGNLVAGQLVSIADQYLVSLRQGDNFSASYTLPDLKEVQNRQGTRIGMAPPAAGRLADGWLLDGILWDDQMKQPKLLLDLLDTRSAQRSNRTPPVQIAAEAVLQGFVLQRGDKAGPQLSGWQSDRPRYTPDFPAQLTFHRVNDRVTLEFADLTTLEVLRTVTLRSQTPMFTRFPYGADWVSIATTHEAVLVSHLGELMVIPVSGLKMTPPFRIVPQQSAVELSNSRPVQVKYHAEGATKFELEIPGLGNGPQPLRLQSADGTFEIDVSDGIQDFAQYLVQSAREIPQAFPGGIEAWAKTYTESQRDQVRKLTGRPPGGVPLRLDAYVRATRQGASATLHHIYLVEVPSKLLRGLPGDRASPPLASSGRKEAPPMPRERPQPAQPSERSLVRTAPTSQRTADEYAQAFRQARRALPTDSAVDGVKADVESLNRKLESELAKGPVGNEVRTWTDIQGRTLRAAFVGAEGNEVIVTDEQSRTFRVPLEKFSETDRKWVRDQPPVARTATSPDRRVRAMRGLGVALHLHHDRLGSFPPAALVSDEGQPLLSWRVLLLEDLGYTSLARLVHYDEPWDSEHNRQLIPLLPSIYCGEGWKPAEGRTPWVGLVDPAGALSDRFAARLTDFKDASSQTLLLAEASLAAAPVWTQPQDIPTTSWAKLAELLAAREGRASVVLADGSLASLPSDTREFEWRKLVNLRDGLKVEAALEVITPPQNKPR